MDRDEWNNMRVLTVEHIFVKAITEMSVADVRVLFNQHIAELEKVIKKQLSNESLRMLLLDLHSKRGALIVVEALYSKMPRGKQEGEIHKMFIKSCSEIVKRLPDDSQRRLMKSHDEQPNSNNLAAKIYRDYVCAAYNCLAVVLICTQPNKSHFKSFLFENNK